MHRIESQMRKAIEDYHMIDEGDKIAVALSGGKDSIALLYCLNNMRRYYPKQYDIHVITINPGFDGFDEKIICNLCKNLGVKYTIVPSQIKQIVFDERKEKNPCSLCANLRRGILCSTAKKLGCNKIALGHNEDDVLETFIMNLTYAGRIDTFPPVGYMDKSDITVIRPLIYVTEKMTKSFIKRNEIQVIGKICEVDGNTNREYALELLKQLEKENKHVRANIYGAIKRSNIKGWNKRH